MELTIQQAIDMAVAHEREGRLQQAAQMYAQIIQQIPDQVDALHRLGLLMMRVGQMKEARELVTRAARASPTTAELFNNLAVINQAMGLMDDAGRCLEEALRLKPDYAEAMNNLGALMGERGVLSTSVKLIRQATELRPGYVDALNNLGNALMRQGLVADALRSYEQAIATNPDHVSARSNYLLTLHYANLKSSAEVFQEHVRWGKRLVELAGPTQPHENDRSPDRKLRVGYLSSDFRAHSVCYFILSVLKAHDRQQVEVVCYADVAKTDAMTEQVRAVADVWRPVAGMPGVQLANRIREDKIDILVDLSGHTSGNRLPVFARRPAPIQISWLGYPDTTGLPTMQYRFTDPLADPVGEPQSLTTETLIRIEPCAWCYQPPDDSPPIDRKPSDVIRFGSFNALAKVSDESIRLWAKVLEAVPNAKMVVKAIPLTDAGTLKSVRERLCSLGLPEHRLETRPPNNTHREHLGAYNEIDIALDTFPYHGTTTTCEALWMGVPVITLAGRSHASRVGVSLLNAVGLSDLIAHSAEEYITSAASLAGDRHRLDALHQSLRQRLQSSVLMDGQRLARSVEQQYRAVWTKWLLS